jgi:hypothetical protein
MNRKRIAQYCCAAIVASGIGLNIQNAIADYGIGEDSLSLLAKPGSGSNSNSNSNSNTNSNSNPNLIYGKELKRKYLEEDSTGAIPLCCVDADLYKSCDKTKQSGPC